MHVEEVVAIYTNERSLGQGLLFLIGARSCALLELSHGWRPWVRPGFARIPESLDAPWRTLHPAQMDGKLFDFVRDSLPCVVAVTSRGRVMLMTPMDLEDCNGDLAHFEGLLLHRLQALRDAQEYIAAR